MKVEKQLYSVVAVPTGIVTLGAFVEEYPGETLSLVDKSSLCFARLMALGKAPIRP